MSQDIVNAIDSLIGLLENRRLVLQERIERMRLVAADATEEVARWDSRIECLRARLATGVPLTDREAIIFCLAGQCGSVPMKVIARETGIDVASVNVVLWRYPEWFVRTINGCWWLVPRRRSRA